MAEIKNLVTNWEGEVVKIPFHLPEGLKLFQIEK